MESYLWESFARCIFEWAIHRRLDQLSIHYYKEQLLMLSEMMRATRGHPHLPYYSLTRCLSLLSYVKRELSNYKLGIINHLLSSPSDAMTTPQWSECESHIYVQVRGVALERLKAQEVSCTARHAGSPFIIRTYMVLVRLRTAGQHFHTRTAVFFPPQTKAFCIYRAALCSSELFPGLSAPCGKLTRALCAGGHFCWLHL